MSLRRRIVIMGAAGRDFHNFNVVYRNDPTSEIVAFTAAQIPGIANRTYPPELAGPLYPTGIPILAETDLEQTVRAEAIDSVVFAYSDVSHETVMHAASRALAAGADFHILGPTMTMLESPTPVIAVTATRTGVGKSAMSLYIARWMTANGHRVGIMRHPMPYGDLARQSAQRFAQMNDLDTHECTVEEREEYTPYIRAGLSVYAGVDYERILALASTETDYLVWDGGNNDFPFIKPDLHLVLVDPLRAADSVAYHPGETNLRMADVCVISKADSTTQAQIATVETSIAEHNPTAEILQTTFAVTIDDTERVRGKRVALVGDGPTLTHGGLATGAASVAAHRFGASVIVDPRPYAVGTIKATLDHFSHLGTEVPAMGYDAEELRDLEATLAAMPADVVLSASPTELATVLDPGKPIVQVYYALEPMDDRLERLLHAFVAAHPHAG